MATKNRRNHLSPMDDLHMNGALSELKESPSDLQFILSSIETVIGQSTTQNNNDLIGKINSFLNPKTKGENVAVNSGPTALVVRFSAATGHLDIELVEGVHRATVNHNDQLVLVFFKVSQSSSTTGGRTIIRWVTDEEAVHHLSLMLKESASVTNEQVVEIYKQLERFVDRPQVLGLITEERGIFMQRLSDWSETLLEIDDDQTDPNSESINANETTLAEDFEIEVQDSSTTAIATELNTIAHRILTLKSRQHLLDQIQSNSAVLFRDVSEMTDFRHNLEQTIKMLADESGQLFARWQSAASNSIRYDLTQPCIVIDETGSQVPRITLTSRLERFAENAARLRDYSYRIPKDIEIVEQHVTRYIDLVRDLRAIVRFYCTVADRILLCHRPLLIDKAKAFTGLLESNRSLTWSDGIEPINAWIGQLKQFRDAFLRENDHLQAKHQAVLKLVVPIIDASFAFWSPTIERIRVIMQELDQKFKHRNTLSWRKHWDYQLYKILEYFFNCIAVEPQQQVSRTVKRSVGHSVESMYNGNQQQRELSRQQQRLIFFSVPNTEPQYLGASNQTVTSVTIELQFNQAGYPAFDPPLESLKQSIFAQLERFVRFPSEFHAFVDWSLDRRMNPLGGRGSSEPLDSGISLESLEQSSSSSVKRTLFHNIYYRNADRFQLVYQKAVDAVQELIAIRDSFRQWCAPYHLIRRIRMEAYEPQTNDVAKQITVRFFTCRSLDQFQHNLKLIKDLSAKFHRQYNTQNEIPCQKSYYVVNILPLKMFIKWLFSEMEQVLLRLLIEQTQQEAEHLEQLCRESTDQMKHRPESIEELIEFDRFITETLPNVRSNLLVESTTMKEKIHFFKTWVKESSNNQMQQNLPKLEDTNKLLSELESIYENRDEMLSQYRELLQGRINEKMKSTVSEVNSFLNRWNDLSDSLKRSPEVISDFQINCNELMASVDSLARGCGYFGLSFPDSFATLKTVSLEIEDLYGKFHVLYEFETGIAVYLDMEWIVCRNKLPKVSQYLQEWFDRVESSTENVLLKSHLDGWKRLLATLELCRGDFYQQIHWQHLLSLLGVDKHYEELKLSDLALKRDQLLQHRSAILELNKRAFNDYSLRETLNELDQFGQNGKFVLYPYQTKEGSQVMLIKDWAACFTQLSDCFLLVAMVRNVENTADGSVSEEFLKAYQEWELKLVRLESLLQLMQSVQRKWISLEPIYHSGSSPSSSGTQANATFFSEVTFTRHSNDFQDLMRTIESHGSQLVRLLTITNLDGRLKAIDQSFATTQKKLRTFIEESRQRFPRFYFLADEDLLLILSGKVDLNQSALIKKLFVNTIGRLILAQSSKSDTGSIASQDSLIEAIESVQGEMIRLRKKIKIDNQNGPLGIENWLKQLDNEIRSTLGYLYNENLEEIRSLYSSEKLWAAVPSQILSVFAWLDFTEKIEDAIRKHTLMELKYDYERVLVRLTRRSESDFFEKFFAAALEAVKYSQISKNINNIDSNESLRHSQEFLCKLKIKQIVLDVIHFINVIESLVVNEVRDLNHWSWQSQLRFYPKSSSETNATTQSLVKSSSVAQSLKIQMGLAQFEYTFEYLGSLGDSKLVHTDLTNKCFLTLTQAMDLGLGGNPYGPAGTGKTESVKALGHHFGRQVLVFNCDEAIDVKSMTRILVGLIKCGSWGCFDEFNRLQLDVLSVLSSQIQEIQNSIKQRTRYVQLTEYGQVEINQNAAIFITLNPAGKEYGGRNRIPDNLKSLFLPVSMTVPDSKTIVRFLLLAEGFSETTAKMLGEKITVWFALAQGSMSKQRHYDWGLRAMKACLEAAGRRLLNLKSDQANTSTREIELFIDTLRQQIKSKLVDEDVSKFDSLVEAVYGPTDATAQTRTEGKVTVESSSIFYEALQKVIKETKLVADEYQIAKVNQLYEQIETRFGIVVIGPPGSGKTTIRQTLRKTLEIVDHMTQNQVKQGTSLKINPIVINPKSLFPRSKLFGYIDEDTREWHDGLFTIKTRDLLRATNEDGGNSTGFTMNWLIFDGDIDPDWVEALNSVLDDNRVLTLPSGERIDFDLNHTRILFETTSLQNASPATISRLGVVSIDSPNISQLIVRQFSELNQLSANSSQIVATFLRTNHQVIVSVLSTTKTLLEHLHYAAANHETENQALDRMTGGRRQSMTAVGHSDDPEKHKFNRLILTDTMARCVQMLRPLVNQHLCLVGPLCSGKSTLVSEFILASSGNAQLVQLDCTPSNDALTLTSAIFSCCTVAGGTLRPQSTATDRLILFVRHCELLQYDKWQSNSFVALLLFILQYGGFYHPDTFEWIQMEHFQVILTCTHVSLLNKRLLSVMHLVMMEAPSLTDLSVILTAKASQINPKLINWFPRKYVQMLDGVTRIEQSQSKLTQINSLKIGNDILDSLNHYDDSILSEHIIDYELNRTLKNHLDNLKMFQDYFKDNRPIIYTSINGTRNFSLVELEAFKNQVLKWVRIYCSENDLTTPNLELFPQTIALVADLCSFMAETNISQTFSRDQENHYQSSEVVKSMVIVGKRGSGRKYFARMMAHIFGFDKVWLPNAITSERHLTNELKTLLSLDDSSGTSGKDSPTTKILILIDQIHFDILPYLRDRIFTTLYSQSFSPSLSIRLIITTSELTSLDRLIWLRQSRLYQISKMSEPEFTKLTERILSGCLSSNKRLLEVTRPILPLFYPVYTHFCLGIENKESSTNLCLYRSYLQTYLQLLNPKMDSLGEEDDRLRSGVGKLDEVATQVNKLKEEAFKQKKLLDSKRSEADEAFQMIMNSMHQSEDKKTELEDVQGKIEVETKNLKERKGKIDEELKQIDPILQAAKAAVGGIQSSALAEIRSLRAPPEVIRDILEGVLRLMGIKDTSWVSMKTFLSRKGMTEIINFDCHSIKPEVLNKVESLLQDRTSSFQAANAKRASVAAASLAEWVKANVEYARVLHKIDPLEQELAKLESGLVSAQSRLKTLNLQLAGVDTEVEALRTRMQAVTVEAAQIEINLVNSSKVLEQSEALMGDLSGEHQRWALKLTQIEADRAQQSTKCLLTAAYICVVSAEPSVQRRTALLKQCIQRYIPELSSDFNPVEFLDSLSEEDVFIKYGPIQPVALICDPTHNVLSNFEANSYEQTRLSAKDWFKVLELAIKFGRTLLITDFTSESLDIRLIPLLCGAIYGSSETRFWTFLGDRKVDYNPKFKLYFLTDTVNQFSSSNSVSTLFRLINLSPSFGSISAQLLLRIINVKRPEIEKQRESVESEVKSFKLQLTNLENELLENLNNSQSDRILENVQLLEKLRFLKKSSKKIEESLSKSAQLSQDLEQQQEQYKSVAEFSANLYFLVASLERLCPMYFFSYHEFEQVFRNTLERFAQDQTLTNDIICYAIYRYVSRALFAEHRRVLWQYFLANFATDISGQTITTGGGETESIGEFLTEMLTPFADHQLRVCMVITSPGSDPTTEIETAINEVENVQFRTISMGNDVLGEVNSLLTANPLATMLQSQQQGTQLRTKGQPTKILCLANLHLVIGWLPQLMQLLTAPSQSRTSESVYSLIILITELNTNFPSNLLGRCTKFAYESVPGIRAHLRRLKRSSESLKSGTNQSTNNTIRPVSSNRTYEETSSGTDQLFTLLEYFHVICCERRFYLPFGWTKNYEFSFNEFRFARYLLQKLLGRKFINNSGSNRNNAKDRQLLLFDYIKGLFNDVIYGGKVDFSVDDRILQLLLKRCFDPDEKFQVDQKGQALSNGTINEFNLLGLPLNADSFRTKSMDERLKQDLQLLSTTSEMNNGRLVSGENQSKQTTRFGMDYFQKLWRKILTKCKVMPSNDNERLFVDDDYYIQSVENAGKVTDTSVDYLHSNEWIDFVRKFCKSQLNYAKKVMEQIDWDLKGFPKQKPNPDVETNLSLNKTPESWSTLWSDGPETAQDLLITLARVYIKLNNQEQLFVSRQTPAKLVFDLSACFQPRLFLNTLRQFAAHRLSVCVDQLQLTYLWSESGATGSRKSSVVATNADNDDESTIRIKLKLNGSGGGDPPTPLITVPLGGLSLEGATFVLDRLQPCNTDSPFVTAMPTVNVVFTSVQKAHSKSSFNSLSSVQLPLYSNSRRQTLLSDSIDVTCSVGTEDRWCEMGVALVLGHTPLTAAKASEHV